MEIEKEGIGIDMRCEYDMYSKSRCPNLKARKMWVGSKQYWWLCREHALTCGFTDREWERDRAIERFYISSR